jgi:hypothetical protein
MEQNNITPVIKPGNIFVRVRNWLGAIGLRVASLFKGPANLGNGEAVKEPPPEGIRQLYDTIDKEALHYGRNLLLPEVEQDFLFSIKFMADAGYADGISGVKTARNNEIAIIAQSRAARLFKQANAVLKGKYAAAVTKVRVKQQLMNRNEQQDAHQHQYFEELQYYRRHHSNRFNFLWSFSCIIIGLALIAADFPLSQKLLQIGFDFRHPADSALTALGVSLCSVFIKIYYDNHINLKYGGAAIMGLRYNEMLKSLSPESQSNSQQEFRGIDRTDHRKKKVWHDAVLLLTIGGIVVLGFFRVEAAKLGGFDFSKTFPTTYLLTFIFLTLIFPLISGICLSIGFAGFQNLYQYNSTKNACTETEKKFIQSLQDFTSAQKEQEDVKSEMDKWGLNDASENYKDILLSYYDYAYKLGAANPNPDNGRDLFSITENWRSKALARKANNHIIKISGL